MPKILGKRSVHPTQQDIENVLKVNQRAQLGVMCAVRKLAEDNINMSYYNIYRIMKIEGMTITSPTKSRRRKWADSNEGIPMQCDMLTDIQ